MGWVRGSMVREGSAVSWSRDAGTDATRGENGGTTDDAARGEDAGAMSRATPSAGRTLDVRGVGVGSPATGWRLL
jgi:hypothetical protein